MARVGLGVVVAQIRGKVGGGVFGRGRSGSNLRVRVRPTNPNTSAQSEVRSAMTAASQAYKALTSGQLSDWRDYALSISRYNAISGSTYHPSAINVFTGLATKFLQLNPGGTIPLTPPAAPFEGDTITVTVAGGADQVTFTGSADNAAGATTELLLQKLPSPNRLPNPQGYKSYGFSDDPDTTPVVVGSLSEGVYVPAYRFVDEATGQATGLIVLPAVTVT